MLLRYARRLRRARRAHQGRNRGSRLRELADLFARGDRLHRSDGRGDRCCLSGRCGSVSCAPTLRTDTNRCSSPRMPVPSSAGRSRKRACSCRPDRARDPARVCLFARLASPRPGDVGQPRDNAPRPPLRPQRSSRRPPNDASRRRPHNRAALVTAEPAAKSSRPS